ncbi:MAG: hypothetical protein AAFQ09_11890 [Pseudomonadota bacterium]
MQLKAFLPLALVAAAATALFLLFPWSDILFWATTAQRSFQDSMARSLGAIRAGDLSVVWALCGATAAYGFVHALGPGHGKVLLGGAALATGATLRRMALLTIVSSLAQAGTAILLVGVIAKVLRLSAAQLGPIADDWLAPASYGAIALLGMYLMWRGMRFWRHAQMVKTQHEPHCTKSHSHTCGCGHAHGPSLDEVRSLQTLREACFLVGAIAIRPCTGAIFVLLIALRFDIFWVGCLAVGAMGLGTASFNLLIAMSGVAARRMSVLNLADDGRVAGVSAIIQIVGGSLILMLSLFWLISL